MKTKQQVISNYEQAAYHLGCSIGHLVKFGTALFRTKAVKVITVITLLASLLLLFGCNSKMKPASPSVQFAPIVASQESKDTTILAEASKIDSIAPLAKPYTDTQRAAVAAAPASDVAKLSKDYEAKLKEQANHIVKLTDMLNEAKSQTDRVIVIGGYGLSALFVSLGVATFFLMAQLPFLGPRIGYALIGAGASVFAMLQAYQWTKAHPWITGIVLLFLAVAAALCVANNLHAKEPAKQ
jgi:hypothetical protein